MMREWLQRAAATANVWKAIPAYKCVSCFSAGTTNDATDSFEGVPMCAGCKSHWELNQTYLTPFEWSFGWADELARLKFATSEKRMTFTNVIVYK